MRSFLRSVHRTRQRTRTFWRNLSDYEKLGLRTGAGVCLVLVGLGLFLDHRNWWGGHPFLVNIISSLTITSLGLPLAIVFLGRVNETVKSRIESRDKATRSCRGFLVSVVDSPVSVAGKVSMMLIAENTIRDFTYLRRIGFQNDWGPIIRSIAEEVAELGKHAATADNVQKKVALVVESLLPHQDKARADLVRLDNWVVNGFPR